jgi:hypothetical protein
LSITFESASGIPPAAYIIFTSKDANTFRLASLVEDMDTANIMLESAADGS